MPAFNRLAISALSILLYCSGASAAAEATAAQRAYIDAARKAEPMPDRSKRCLAYPELPGARWPAGLVQAWCAERQLISLADVDAHLKRGDLAGLDAAYRRHLDLHFSESDFSELIHNDFLYFTAEADAADITARWLARAPDSPYANAARAAHLLKAAIKARGADVIANTSEQQIRSMRQLTKQATTLIDKALTLEPRLLSAHEHLIAIGMLHGADGLVEQTYRRAARIDPGCRFVTQAKMLALRPKWGGSQAAMARFARELEPQLARRPLLINTIVIPEIEHAQELFDAKQYQQVVDLLAPVAPRANAFQVHSLLGRAMAFLPRYSAWDGLVHLLQSSRFMDGYLDNERELTRVLANLGEYDWAILHGRRALAIQPDDARTGISLGTAYMYSQRPAEAESPLLLAMQDEELRPRALEKLNLAMGMAEQWAKAEPYAEQLTREQPANGWGWYTLGLARIHLGKPEAALAALESFVKVADRSDEQLAERIPQVEQMIASYKQAQAKRSGAQQGSSR